MLPVAHFSGSRIGTAQHGTLREHAVSPGAERCRILSDNSETAMRLAPGVSEQSFHGLHILRVRLLELV
jgi:hypothetical protein